MVKDLIGYRFSPTGEELVNHYLKNKNLGKKSWLVDEAISEINILSYIPEYLPDLARIRSEDLEWYFFSPIEYTNLKKNAMKRTTGSGFWKPTGKDRIIRDKRGNGVDIGFKKTLVYHENKVPHGVRTPWVMHEYHITCLPHDKRNYVICQVKYKGEAADISYGNNLTAPSHSLVSDSNTARPINTAPEPAVEQPGGENFFGISVDDLIDPMNEQEDLSEWDAYFDPNTFFSDNINKPYLQAQAPHLAPNDDEFLGGLRHVDRGHVEYLFANEDNISRPTLFMTENRNDHMPKKALSGIITDYSCDTDSDAESISATSYQGTSSPGDSVGSSNRYFPSCANTDSCNDLQTSADPSISKKTQESQLTWRTVPSKQEVKEGTPKAIGASMEEKSSSVKTEKKGLFILEEAMERNRKYPRYIYFMNMIIGFILLLALIGNIISVKA